MTKTTSVTHGLDVGDRHIHSCGLDDESHVVLRTRIETRQVAVQRTFGKLPGSLVALELGRHSPRLSRALAALGHDVVVTNPRMVRLITDTDKKKDRLDAEKQARLARVDRALLHPTQHRREDTQAARAFLRSREVVGAQRTQAIAASMQRTSSEQAAPACWCGQSANTRWQDARRTEPLMQRVHRLRMDARLRKLDRSGRWRRLTRWGFSWTLVRRRALGEAWQASGSDPGYNAAMLRPLDTTPEAHAVQMRAYRAMGPGRRLEVALKMASEGRDLSVAGIRRRHPTLTSEEALQRLVVLLYGDDHGQLPLSRVGAGPV